METAFWDRAARKYAAAPMRDPAAYERSMARIEAHLAPQHRVLELGAGSGATALRLAPQVRHVLATDISGEMVAIGQEKAAQAGVQTIAFRRAALGDTAFAEAPFDVVLALNLLHLVEDLPAALAHIHGLLPPGGLFVSKTTCLAGNLIFPIMIKAMQLFKRAPHVAYLSPGMLDGAIRDAGFEIIETLDAPAKPPARLIIARRCQ